MKRQIRINEQRRRRRGHVRRVIRGTAERPRLSIFRSGKHISAQVIDDETGKTLAAASTTQKAIADALSNTASKEAAEKVGSAVAERAKEAGIERVAFDRGHYKYHGRVAALAEAARKAGLQL